MTFDKTIQKPLVKKEKKYTPFDYGFDIDMEKIKNDINTLQYSRKINFLMHDVDVKRMLSYNNIRFFKKITGSYANTVVDIQKTRNKWRKISINGDDAYIVYKKLKAL